MFGKNRTGYTSPGRHDPLRAFNFEVVFTGKIAQYRTGFNKVGGLKVQTDHKEYKEGGNNGIADIIPMDTKFEPIEMSGGATPDLSLLEAFAGQFDKAGKGHMRDFWTVDIVLYDRDGTHPVRKTRLTNALITRYEEGDYDAQSGTIALEKIIVQFTGAEVKRK